jgi:hypothetical protein
MNVEEELIIELDLVTEQFRRFVVAVFAECLGAQADAALVGEYEGNEHKTLALLRATLSQLRENEHRAVDVGLGLPGQVRLGHLASGTKLERNYAATSTVRIDAHR